MNVIQTSLNGVLILEPRVFTDNRGCFFESFSERHFVEQVCQTKFVQDNESYSVYGVIRGLHYQLPPHSQSKLVRVVRGQVLDVAVDIRRGSPTFGQHVAVELSETNRRQFFIPRGFAHGFSVLSPEAVFQYKCDDYYAPECEEGVIFDDPAIGIDWGIPAGEFIVSDKDRGLRPLIEARLFDYTQKLF